MSSLLLLLPVLVCFVGAVAIWFGVACSCDCWCIRLLMSLLSSVLLRVWVLSLLIAVGVVGVCRCWCS